jgi:branched-subunit amino acid transport protein
MMDTTLAMAENSQPPAPPPPPGNFSAQHMMPFIIVDAALPAVSYWTLSYYGVSTISALIAVSIFPAAKVALGWLRAHRLDLLGIIALGFIFVGVAASLISGNIFFALIRDRF